MPKCLECGFEAPRLQWTHFKYNCTGRFSNGTEYKKHYPDATLVDPDLAKKTAVTKDNLVKKYGAAEGQRRWEEYRKRQAKSNSYEYKKHKHGWSKKQYDDFNKSRSVTLENLIEKHGEAEGAYRWQHYCERQAYTNTLNYFVEKYGAKDGIEKYQHTNSLKAQTIENVARVHSCSYQEAAEILQARSQRLGFTSKLEHAIIEEIELLLGEEISYSVKTKQYCVYGNNKANFYDIVHNNRAIEIRGDYWHCNPLKYQENFFHPHTELTAKEIWTKDKQKIQILEQARNIPVMVIWESEYIERPRDTVRRCMEWIQNDKK